MSKNRAFLWGKIGLHLLLPLPFFIIPTSRLEATPSICLVRRIFGVPCPGCGMTRAISSICHARFAQAWRYNKLVVIVLPLLCYTWAQSLLQTYKKLQDS